MDKSPQDLLTREEKAAKLYDDINSWLSSKMPRHFIIDKLLTYLDTLADSKTPSAVHKDVSDFHAVDKKLDYALAIEAHQEEFAAAFLKKTGLDPAQCVMNIQQCNEHSHGFWGTRIWFEKREDETPQEWQPIETAPKDGTAILICVAGPQIDIGWWDDSINAFRDYYHKQNIGLPYFGWMPLPSPPTLSAKDNKNEQ